MKTIVILACIALASCAGFDMPPIAVSVQDATGTYGYSSKTGLFVEIDSTK